jgi:subtilisin family serine protease
MLPPANLSTPETAFPPAARTTFAPERAARVVDLATWVAASPRPDLATPTLPPPPRPERRAGLGLRIAVLDAAVDRSHPDLADARIVLWPPTRDVVPDPQATAYASLLVGQGAAHVRGLLPAAELMTASVRTPDGHGEDEVLARAVRWAVGRGAHVLVIPSGRRRLGRRVTTTLRGAMADGVRVFAAAGNLGPSLVAFPAAVSGVVAVTAHDDAGFLPQCSTHADLAAPGRDVPAAGPRRRAHLQGSGPAAVLAAGCHLLWLDQAGLGDHLRTAAGS